MQCFVTVDLNIYLDEQEKSDRCERDMDFMAKEKVTQIVARDIQILYYLILTKRLINLNSEKIQ